MDKKVLTLYYHRVAELTDDYNLLAVAPDNFYQQMLYLKKNYRVERFEADWTNNNENSVVITFDDGYRDNLEFALPILEELEVPATIFVSTGTLDSNKEMWWDELEHYLLIGNDFPEVFELKDKMWNCRWKTETTEQRKNCYSGLHLLMKNIVEEERRDEWMMQLSKWRNMDRIVHNGYEPLSEQDCCLLNDSNFITLGAHTISHISLGNYSYDAQDKEITTSIKKMSSILSKKIEVFSYPFGSKSDYNENTFAILEKNGIKKSATTIPKLWDIATNPYEIPRKIVRNWDVLTFENIIENYWKEDN